MSDPLGVAVVTGAAGLLGRTVCTTLATGGHRVVAVDRDTAALDTLVELTSGAIETVVADVTDHAATSELWRTASWAPQVRSVVCVAGGPVIAQQPAEEIGAQDFESVLALNLTAAWTWCTEAVPIMKARGEGRLVLFSSDSVLGGIPGGMAPYIASKAALVGLARALSRELGPHDITVNCVSPGVVIDQDRVRPSSPERERRSAQIAAEYLAVQALPSPVTPRQVAGAVSYLLSPDAGSVTGEVMHVGGGCFFGS